jgi:biotin operon repressor
LEEKEQMVLEAMEKAGKPVRSGEVAKTVGLARDEVSKIIRGLKKKGKVTSLKRCFYAPAK